VLSFAVTSFVASAMAGKGNVVKTHFPQEQQLKVNTINADDINKSEEVDIFKMAGLSSINFPKLLICFIFYFLGGYLLYSALFAAIGAAVDSETDTQQFMFPITIPLVFAYIVATIVMQNPESALGYWFSIIPLTSPIVMMVRMPFDPPWIDIFISMGLLILGFLGTTWLAAKIYRVGILMYGKKPTYKELGKWIFYKG
jgi:ABC-2 type transport system permease protein